MSAMASASLLSRQRRRPSNEDFEASTPTNGVASNCTDVVLSLRDERYKEAMCKQFNILGDSSGAAREEKIAVELFTQFKKEGGRFYRMEKGGGRLMVKEEEAFEKIKRDIKNTDFAHRWLGKQATDENSASEVPSVSDNSYYSGDKIVADNDEPAVKPSSKLPQSSVEYFDPDSENYSIAEHLGNKKRQQERLKEEKNAEIDCAKSYQSMNTLGGKPHMPNENDTVLSLHDPKYRNAMFKCFQELEKGSPKEIDMGNRIINEFKRMGGRFFKVVRDGKAYVEVDETMALQKILEDIWRRSGTSTRLKLDIDCKGQGEGQSSSEAGNVMMGVGLSQEKMPKSRSIDQQQNVTNQASATIATQLSYPISVSQKFAADRLAIDPERSRTKQTSILNAPQLRCQERGTQLQAEEKKQDDCDVESTSKVKLKQDHDAGFRSAAKPKDDHHAVSSAKANCELQGEDEKEIAYDVGSLSEAKSIESQSVANLKEDHDAGSPSVAKPKNDQHVASSAEANCELLGEDETENAHDAGSSSEVKPNEYTSVANLKEDHGARSPSTAKPRDDHDVVSSVEAKCELSKEDDKQYGHAAGSSSEGKRIESPSVANLKKDHETSIPSAAKPKDDHYVASSVEANYEFQGDDKRNGDAVGSSSEAKSKTNCGVESPNEGKPNMGEISLELEERPPFNVILSLTDDYYKETMWKHYKELGKAKNHDREEEIGLEIFNLFKQKLGNKGKFFKRAQYSRNQDIEVNDEKALDKIIADIRRRMKSWKKWADSPEKQAAKPKATCSTPIMNSAPKAKPPSPSTSRPRRDIPMLNSAPAAKIQSLSTSRPKREHQSKISSMNENTSPRRSARKPIPSEAARNKDGPGDKDVILSFNDERYKEIMWRHYNILGKKMLVDNREEDVVRHIFSSLKGCFGKGGNFFKKMSRSDDLFAVDDEGALRKITRDLKRRNETINKWKWGDNDDRLEKAPLPTYQEVTDHPHLPIEQDHAWRDQLVPSPIEAAANHRAKPPPQVPLPPVNIDVVDAHPFETHSVATHPVSTYPSDTHPVDNHPIDKQSADEKPLSVPKNGHNCPVRPNHVQQPRAKSCVELLESSHLGQRLPPLKSFPTVKSVHTPAQLIYMLQHATHKLNELCGCSTRHYNAMRLYHLSELNDKSTSKKAPTLSLLAEFMETTAKSLKKWYTMYRNAIMKGFDFDQFGNDKIKDHYGVFFVAEEHYQLSKCGEIAMKEYFLEVVQIVVGRAGTGVCRSSEMKKIGSQRCDLFDVTHGINNDESLHKNSFLHNFEKNEARLLDLKNKNGKHANPYILAMQLSNNAKRIKRGVKDRMLCMVKGCEKHAQTKCDGCCTAHFRVLSSTTGKYKKKPLHALTSTLAIANDGLGGAKCETSVTLGKRKVREIDTHAPLPVYNINPSKLETGSRIFVQWDGDNNLYKATVKRLFLDREVPMVKIHYDGKKRHILNAIPLEMVKSFIEGETVAPKPKHAENPVGFAGLKNVAKPVYNELPQFEDECQEISTINQRHPVERGGGPGTTTPQLSGRSFLSKNRHNFSMTKLPAKSSPNSAQRVPKYSGTRSLITISPITTEQSGESHQLSTKNHPGHSPERNQATHLEVLPKQKISMLRSTLPSRVLHPSLLRSSASTTLPSLKPPDSEVSNCFQSPKEVAELNSGVLNRHLSAKKRAHPSSAFTSPSRIVRPPLHHQLYQTSSIPLNNGRDPGLRSSSAAQRNYGDHAIVALSVNDAKNEETDSKRSKRKPKPVTRFDEEDIPSSRPSILKGGHFKSVLCHCPDCDKRDLSVQGIYAHYGRAHSGKLSWQRVTFSCPFCPSSKSSKSRSFKSFPEAEAHVSASHPGCDVVGPHPSKLSEQSASAQSISVQINTKKLPQDIIPKSDRSAHNNTQKLRQDIVSRSDRVLRERKPTSFDHDAKTVLQTKPPQVVAPNQGHPLWTRIEYVQLLPDGRKDYPSDLCRVIDMIDEQCQAQEEIVEVAHEQRIKLCRSEAESETKALDEERLSYSRGVRERMRLADGERIERQKFTEDAEHLMIRYQYENRNKRRNQEEIEVDKLCSRPIRFSREMQRHNTRQGKACKDDECQFCKKNKGYLHHLLLNNEMSAFKMDAPAILSPVFQQSTKVLNPSFRIINDNYFLEAEAAENFTNEGKEGSGGKRVNQSRRDASTAKRLKMEEDRLLMLKNTKHSLEFIKKYNAGMITNAWGELKKDSRGRKSY